MRQKISYQHIFLGATQGWHFTLVVWKSFLFITATMFAGPVRNFAETIHAAKPQITESAYFTKIHYGRNVLFYSF